MGLRNGGHRKHGPEVLSTSHIRNVGYLATHDLVRCGCGFYGWIDKAEIAEYKKTRRGK